MKRMIMVLATLKKGKRRKMMVKTVLSIMKSKIEKKSFLQLLKSD